MATLNYAMKSNKKAVGNFSKVNNFLYGRQLLKYYKCVTYFCQVVSFFKVIHNI